MDRGGNGVEKKCVKDQDGWGWWRIRKRCEGLQYPTGDMLFAQEPIGPLLPMVLGTDSELMVMCCLFRSS